MRRSHHNIIAEDNYLYIFPRGLITGTRKMDNTSLFVLRVLRKKRNWYGMTSSRVYLIVENKIMPT